MVIDDILHRPDESSDESVYQEEGIFEIQEQTCSQILTFQRQKPSTKYLVFDVASLYCFRYDTFLRQKVVQLSVNPLFENGVIVAIFCNSIVLAIYNYDDRENLTEFNQTCEAFGHFFTLLFTIEFLIRIVAMGFVVHKNSYMRDYWNWLDFLVVIVGLLELSPFSGATQSGIKSLRVLRVLRPLKSINAFPSMRKQISSLLGSLSPMLNAVLFLFFIFLLFGILGVQQFGGTMYNRCRFTEKPVDGLWPYNEEIDRLCKEGTCPEGQFCRSPQDANLPASIDKPIDQVLIDYGVTTFDNILKAMVTVFQMITLEGWTKIMYNLMDSNLYWMAIIFSILLVFIGAFFLLNVVLAVLVQAQA